MDFVFVRCIICCTRLRNGLLAYQAIIADANQKFHADRWLAYDCQFCTAAAANPSLRWDVVEPTLWQLTLTGKARPPCFACRLPHPLSRHCPFRSCARHQPSFHRPTTVRNHEVCHNFNLLPMSPCLSVLRWRTPAPNAQNESLDQEVCRPTSLAVNSTESAGPLPFSLKPSTLVNVRRMKALLADHP